VYSWSPDAIKAGILVAVDGRLRRRQNGGMKTTLDLPNDLVQEIKLRAVSEGRKLKDVAADLLRVALTRPAKSNSLPAAAVPKTLPVIKVRSAPPGSAANLTAQEFCDWIKQADLDLEVERYEKAFGHQHVDRAQS
jgi:plasmid stability protein